MASICVWTAVIIFSSHFVLGGDSALFLHLATILAAIGVLAIGIGMTSAIVDQTFVTIFAFGDNAVDLYTLGDDVTDALETAIDVCAFAAGYTYVATIGGSVEIGAF